MTLDHLEGALMVIIVAGIAYAARSVWEGWTLGRLLHQSTRLKAEAEE